jgi:hypothetical protein
VNNREVFTLENKIFAECEKKSENIFRGREEKLVDFRLLVARLFKNR